MPKVSPIQNSFNAGEFSPKLYASNELDRYKAGLEICENYVPTLQGPLLRRPGTKFVHPVRHPAKETDIFPFKYSRTDSYIIERGIMDEFSNEYFRFFKDNDLLTLPEKTITAITSSNPITVTCAGHGLFDGSRVVLSGISGMTQLNNREFIAATVSANAFTLKSVEATTSIDGTSYAPYTSGGVSAAVFEVVGAVNVSSTLPPLSFAQSGDVVFFVAETLSMFKLSRFGDTSWTFSNLELFDGPYLPVNSTGNHFTISDLISGYILADSTIGINNDQGFQSQDVGRLIRILGGGRWGCYTITNVGSNVSVSVAVGNFGVGGSGSNQSVATLTRTYDWRLGAYRPGEFPTGITFHEDRLCLFGGINGQMIALSETGGYENFAPSDVSGSIADDDGMTLILNSTEANTGQWLVSDEKGLLAGTSGGPWVVRPSTLGEALTPFNANAKKTSSYGSLDVQPAIADKATIYIQNSGRKVRELLYYYDVDGYRASDISILSDHIFGTGAFQLAFQKDPQPLVWAVRNDGTLTSVVYERDVGNIKAGWVRHILGGFSDSSHSVSAKAERIAVIPSADGTREELWTVVNRYINGRSTRYIEYMEKFFEDIDDPVDSYHLDCGLTYDATPTSSISGLNHLEGEVVSILADGAVHPDRTVTLGGITLDTSASVIHIGYDYKSRGKMLRLNAGAADGTALGKTQRTHRVGMHLHRTGALKIGYDFSTGLNPVIFRKASDNMDEAVPLFSGIISETVEGDYNTENQLCFQQDAGLPGTILAIMPQLVTQDR